MSSLDRLAIRGIRSFDSEALAVIQFYSPLTVIVGHNGSGKTTIIESLKYVTTGDLPPNTKGGAFVHDPALAGDTQVKAEVMLRFHNMAGDRMVASRRLQVSKKKAALTMKTLEGTLSYEDKGGHKTARRTLSTKCAELDAEIPRQLGVSKAILENVIFCHQEDSNWPLAEPAGLKKKFDDIFEATKYTKALDNIKAIRKEATAELKVDKERLEALKTDKVRAEKLSKSIEKLAADIEIKKIEHDDLDAKVANLANQNKQFYEGAAKYYEILKEAEAIRERQRLIQENIDSLLENMEELRGDSDDDLRQKLEASRRKIDTHAERLSEKKRFLADEQDELAKLRRGHMMKVSDLGKLKAQAQRYETALEERRELIVRLSGTHQIKGFELSQLSQNKVEDFFDTLNDLQRKQSNEIEAMRNESKRREELKQAEINKLQNEDITNRQAKQSMSEQVTGLRRRIDDLTTKIENVKTTDADLKYAETNLQDIRDRVRAARDAQAGADFEAAIKAKMNIQRKIEDERDELHQELAVLNTQADTRARLAIKRADVRKKDDAIQSLIDRHGARFRELVGSDMGRDDVEKCVNEAMSGSEADLNGAESVNAASNRDLQAADANVTFNSGKLDELRKELIDLTRHLRDNLEGQPAAQKISDAEEEVEERKKELSTMDMSVKFFEKILKNSKHDNKCGACRRPFKGQELQDFERFCRDQIQNAPRRKRETEEELKDWQQELEEMRKMLPLEKRADDIRRVEIPKFEKGLADAQSKHDTATKKATEAQKEVNQLKEQLRDFQLLKRHAADIVRMMKEMRDLEREIGGLEEELQASGSTRTSDDVQAELNKLASTLSDAKKELHVLTSDREKKRAAIQALETQIHSSEMALAEKRQALKERESFEQLKEDLRSDIADLERKQKVLEQKLTENAAPLRKLNEELKQLRNDHADRESSASRRLAAYHKSLDQVEQINKEISRYERGGGEAELRQCESQIRELDLSINAASENVSAVQGAINALDKESSEVKSIERNLGDNIRLRTYRKDIRHLTDRLEEMDVAAAEKAHQKFDAEYKRSMDRQKELSAQQSRLAGEIGTVQANLDEKKNEMSTEFKQIETRYIKQLVKVKTCEVANQDLEKYAKALDSAIMKYHSHKMEEINDTIYNLWQKTYQGTDIDKIMIKSENENLKNNRSYNYRVVMLKDSVEMDMRGRCSAGQKVLASIIIRLALAESFGTNCGVLALDEPTTNLDRENIEALAKSLAEIIQERRGQANFQLIVITHDEDFLSELGKSDALDRYWRVHRNSQQKSVIERQRL